MIRAVAAMTLLAACSSPESSPAPGPEPHHWVGADGRTVIHRGMNVNQTAKGTPTYHHSLEAADLALLRTHGITLARYLVFWEALEPEDGAIDPAALDQISADLDELHAAGLEVIVDLHQDVYGAGFGFTGLPSWTCAQEQYDAFVGNDLAWYLNYADPAVVACFDAFWADGELHRRYGQAVAEVLRAVEGHPALVGLDVINEPYWGSHTLEDHDREVLPRFYGAVLDEVRPVAPELMVWLAPSVGANLTGLPHLELGELVDRGPIGVTPHFYPLYAESGTGWDGTWEDEGQVLDALASHAERQQVPLFLGEFGIFSQFGNEPEYVRRVLGELEARGGSTAYWSYDRGGDLLEEDGSAGWLLPAFADPYAHRIPGRLVRQEGARVELWLEGDGVVDWVVPGEVACSVVGESIRVVSTKREAELLRAHVVGTGRGVLDLDCG